MWIDNKAWPHRPAVQWYDDSRKTRLPEPDAPAERGCCCLKVAKLDSYIDGPR